MPVPATRLTQRRWRTSLAALAAIGMGSVLLVGAHQASAAPTGPDPQQAAAYLTAPAQLVDGHYYDPFGLGQADWGLTIDGALALAAQGGKDAAYGKLVDFLAANGKDPAGTDVISWTGIGTEFVDGGSIGKLALLAEVAGRDPHQFAGHDLVAELAKATCTSTTPIGQSPCAAAGNYAGGSSVFKQALGLIGQVRGGAGDVAVAPAAAYLLGLQSADGGWPSLIPSGGAASDVDSTAIAVMALTLVPGDAAAAATARGIAWVAGTQLADGAFPGFAPPGSEPAHSTNSTALALQALRLSAGDHSAQIAKALTFLAGTQNGDGGFDIDSANDFSDVRATAQVVGGIVGRSYATLLHSLGASAHAVTGAAYLVGRLTDGTHLESSFDDGQGGTVTFVDYGLTADLALALASANSQDATLAKVVGYLRAHVGDYVDQSGAAGGPYSGAAGKLAVLAESTGQESLGVRWCRPAGPPHRQRLHDRQPRPERVRPLHRGRRLPRCVLRCVAGPRRAGPRPRGRCGPGSGADEARTAPVRRRRVLQRAHRPGGGLHLRRRHDRVCGSGPQPAAQRPGFGRPRLGVPARRSERRRRLVRRGGGQLELDGSRDPGACSRSSTEAGTWRPPPPRPRRRPPSPPSPVARPRPAPSTGRRPRTGSSSVCSVPTAASTCRPPKPVTTAPGPARRPRRCPPSPERSSRRWSTPSLRSTRAPPTTTTTTSTTPPTSTTSTTSTTTDPSSTTSSTSATTPPTSTGSASSTPSGGSTPAGTVAASGGLASTGTPVGLIVAVGVLLLLAGLVLLVGRRMTAGGDRR